MESRTKKYNEEILMDNLLKEAYEILNKSENLNGEREKLTSILNKIAIWKEDTGEDEKYYDAFQKVILSMAMFDFTKRLPVSFEQKSVQNFFSVTLNSLNDELQDKIVSKALMSKMLKELPLKNIVVVGTDILGKINFFHTNEPSTFPDLNFFNNQNINVLFEDMEDINNQIQREATEFNTKLKFGYKGIVHVKITASSWLHRLGGLLYIITIPENNQSKKSHSILGLF
jgi:hypothetical protein